MKAFRMVIILLAVLCLVLNLPAQERDETTQYCPIYGPGGQIMPPHQGPYYTCQGGAWTSEPSTDDINLAQIGSTVGPMYNTMSGGDSDGDGLFEAYFYIGVSSTFTYRGYERRLGTNVYNQVFQNTAGMIPYAYGDVDSDSLPDVTGQWSSWVYVYESPALGQYANTQVWQSPSVVNVTGYTTIGDLDGDGFGEIIHTNNSFGSNNYLVIWEKTGNNQFQEIYNQWVSNNNLGQKAVADFDGDNHKEVAFSSGGGDVYVFESTGPNAIQLKYQGTMGVPNAYACVLGHDMDGNGRPEFIVGGSGSGQGWVTKIFEAAGNDSFVVRQTIIINDNYFGVPGVCAGDLDGDGVDEFIIQIAQALRVFDWNATTQTYMQVQNVPENFGSILHGIFAFDSNNNANDDVFWLGIDYSNNSVILESPPTTQPQLVVNLTPLPSQPPYINFEAAVVNNDPVQAPFWVWGRVRYSNGTYSPPNLGPVQINPPVGVAVMRVRTLNYSGFPPGLTTQYGYANGNFGYPALASDSFTFTVGGNQLGVFDPNPYCQGELFPGEEAFSNPPSAFSLCSASPNPFNPTTTISFELRAASHISLKVYDTTGRLVATLVDGWQEAGDHQVTFDGAGLSAGVYLYHLESGGRTVSGKLMLVK